MVNVNGLSPDNNAVASGLELPEILFIEVELPAHLLGRLQRRTAKAIVDGHECRRTTHYTNNNNVKTVVVWCANVSISTTMYVCQSQRWYVSGCIT